MFDALDLMWLWDGIGALPRVDRWQTQARSAVRDDLLIGARRADRRRASTAPAARSTRWLEANERSVARAQAMFTEIRRGRELRPDDAVRRPPPAAQPRPHVGHHVSAQPRVARATRAARMSTRTPVGSVNGPCRPPRVPLRAVADGVLPRRRGAHGALQLGAGPPARAGRSCCASRTPTRPATGRSGRRGSSTPWPGSASRADDPTFEGPYFQSANAAAHVAAAERLFADGSRLLLRPDRRADPGARQGSGPAGLRRLLARPRPRSRARVGCCASACPTTARRSSTTSIRGEVVVRQRDDRGLRAAARQRHADVPARQRRRRHRDGHHPRRARRGAPAEHAEAAAAVGGARPRAAGVGPRAGARQRAAQEAVQAARQGGARAVPRRGLPRRRRWSTT